MVAYVQKRIWLYIHFFDKSWYWDKNCAHGFGSVVSYRIERVWSQSIPVGEGGMSRALRCTRQQFVERQVPSWDCPIASSTHVHVRDLMLMSKLIPQCAGPLSIRFCDTTLSDRLWPIAVLALSCFVVGWD